MLNDYYQNVGVKGYFDRYGIWYGLRRALFNGMPLHCVKDYEIKKVLWQKAASKYIKRYVKYKDKEPAGLVYNAKSVPDNPIWVFWNNGMENAPDIVKTCYKTIKKYGGDAVVSLSECNIGDYIIFPDYIQQKVNNGMIPMAGYTDLMRFALLEHYGGTWIDATVYLSGPIPSEILSSDFFVLRNTMMLVDNPVLYPAWFLHAKAGNTVIKQIRNVAFAYWINERHVIEYLLPNIIIKEVLNYNSSVEKSMPYMSSDYSEYLVKQLGNEFEVDKWHWIMKLTNIHKLTYKLSPEIDRENTFYNKIVKDSKID